MSVDGKGYYVLAKPDMTAQAATAVVTSGGTIEAANQTVGLFRVSSSSPGYAETIARLPGVELATTIEAAQEIPRPTDSFPRDTPTVHNGAQPEQAGPTNEDPLDIVRWDHTLIGADKARAAGNTGEGVTIGIMDSGVDETHPDIAPNYNEGLSRNFTVQDLDSDVPNPHWHNPCPADGCLADAGAAPDEAHGTSVAGVAAAAANGIGVSGVAPDASIVSLRVFAGDEDGMDLLWPVNALTYAGARGINVVNMSFMVRQWLDSYSHPASTWTPGRELSAIAVNRALEYAHARGVTLVAAAGNELADFSEALPPLSVPLSLAGKGNNLAGGLSQLSLPHPVVLPAQGAYVIGAIAVGPGGEKATYSNYGSQFESARLIAAPGGDADAVDPAVGQDTGEILSAVPGGRWEYAQGTSLAAPQIAGSAALVIAKFGTQDPANPERTTMPPDLVWEAIRDGATPTPCPPPRPPNFTYKGKLIPPQQCIGPPGNNSFYGSGTVNVPRSLSNRPGMTAQ